jgi:hypothetical protein
MKCAIWNDRLTLDATKRPQSSSVVCCFAVGHHFFCHIVNGGKKKSLNMAELGDFMVPQDGEAEFTKDVTVDMLDYKYVEECTDAQKLKQVLAVLKSGKEGFYPQLIQATEEKLLVLLPVKERQQVMRMKAQVSPAEICEAESGLSAWQSKIVGTDKELSSVSKSSGETKPVASKRLPPVRGSTSSSPPTSSNDSLSESSADEKAQLLRVAGKFWKSNSTYVFVILVSVLVILTLAPVLCSCSCACSVLIIILCTRDAM